MRAITREELRARGDIYMVERELEGGGMLVNFGDKGGTVHVLPEGFKGTLGGTDTQIRAVTSGTEAVVGVTSTRSGGTVVVVSVPVGDASLGVAHERVVKANALEERAVAIGRAEPVVADRLRALANTLRDSVSNMGSSVAAHNTGETGTIGVAAAQKNGVPLAAVAARSEKGGGEVNVGVASVDNWDGPDRFADGVVGWTRPSTVRLKGGRELTTFVFQDKNTDNIRQQEVGRVGAFIREVKGVAARLRMDDDERVRQDFPEYPGSKRSEIDAIVDAEIARYGREQADVADYVASSAKTTEGGVRYSEVDLDPGRENDLYRMLESGYMDPGMEKNVREHLASIGRSNG